jgi:DNA-binding beta-propeller fold protein YncE
MGGLQDTLRRAGIVAAIAAVLSLAGAASAGAAPLLWSLNNSTNSVSTIETTSNQVTGTAIPTGGGPNSIAITPNGHRAVVTNFVGNSITVIETATRAPAATIPLPAHGERVAITPDGKSAWVTVEGGEKVFLVDPESNTNATVGSFTVGPEPFAVAFTPDGRFAYVGIEEEVQVVETATGTLVGKPIKVGGLADWIVFTPDGRTAYVSENEEVAVIDTALGQVTKHILIGTETAGLAVTPDGRRLFVAGKGGTVTVVETATNERLGSPITVGGEPQEIAITPDGKTAYVGIRGLSQITPITVATNQTGTPMTFPGADVERLVVAPDQSPTASFAPPTALVGTPAVFSGAASTDPDGSVAAWNWSFGEGGIGIGQTVSHSYSLPGTYNTSLSVVDNEGCGAEEVFTGRTAYCSGNPLAKATHPVEVKTVPIHCSSRFRFGSLVHNRKNGTVRLQVKLPGAGSILLFGKKIHAVTRKVKKAGSTFLTLHARVELNKRLKKIHRTSVRFRLTFTPTAGCGFKTVHRSVALLRASRKRHR